MYIVHASTLWKNHTHTNIYSLSLSYKRNRSYNNVYISIMWRHFKFVSWTKRNCTIERNSCASTQPDLCSSSFYFFISLKLKKTKTTNFLSIFRSGCNGSACKRVFKCIISTKVFKNQTKCLKHSNKRHSDIAFWIARDKKKRNLRQFGNSFANSRFSECAHTEYNIAAVLKLSAYLAECNSLDTLRKVTLSDIREFIFQVDT